MQSDWRLGHIAAGDRDWLAGLDADRVRAFYEMKLHLPAECNRCERRLLCHGGCTKHRPHRGAAAERSVLCDGYRLFFEHASLRLEWLAAHVINGTRG